MPSKKNNDNTIESIDKIIDGTFEKLKKIVDANTSIGDKVSLGNNKFIVPISKISVGIVSGGGECPNKKNVNKTAGSTSGFSITPIGFVAVSENGIDYISTEVVESNTARIIESMVSLAQKYMDRLSNDEN